MIKNPAMRCTFLVCFLLAIAGCGFAKKEKKAAEAEEQTRLINPYSAKVSLFG